MDHWLILLMVLAVFSTKITAGENVPEDAIPDETDCHKYEVIKRTPSGAYQAERKSCSPGTMFSSELKRCIPEDTKAQCQPLIDEPPIEKPLPDCFNLGETSCADCNSIKLCNQDLYGNKMYQTVPCPQGTYCNEDTNICEAAVPLCSPFTCVQEGVFPDNRDCVRYHHCQKNFSDQIKLCPPGSSFNPATSLCDLTFDQQSCFQSIAPCNTPTRWELLPIRGSCLIFYTCNDWEPEFHKCPPGKALMCRQTSTTSSTRNTPSAWPSTTTDSWPTARTTGTSPESTTHPSRPTHGPTTPEWPTTGRPTGPTSTWSTSTTTTTPTTTTSMPSGDCQCVSLAEITDKKCLQEAEFHGEICFKSGYVPDPMEACPTRAFLCAQNGTKDGQPYFSLVYIVNCPDGQAFDMYSDTCKDYEKVVHCRIEDVCTYGGNHAYPADGKKFYHCKWPGDMDPEIITCPDDLIYNKATGICD